MQFMTIRVCNLRKDDIIIDPVRIVHYVNVRESYGESLTVTVGYEDELGRRAELDFYENSEIKIIRG